MAIPTPRPRPLNVPPFQLGESSIPGVKRVIQLASNECAAEPSPRAIAAYHAEAARLRRYPNASAAPLREAIGTLHGIDPARVLSGHGSEDFIGLVARSYAGPGD